MNTLFWLTRKAAEILGPGFDLEIVEMHHRLKRDAPSGTAKTLAEILAAVRKQQLRQGGAARPRRASSANARRRRSACIRCAAATWWATTRSFLPNTGERVELTHKASSRDTFANGALRAAQWVVKQKPGLYDMQDVLGLK